MQNAFVYICDGTAEGLLSCIYESYYSGENVYDITRDENFQKSLLLNYRHIDVDFDSAQKVAYSIRSKISRHAFDNIIKTWLSELPMCGHYILEYVRLGYIAKSGIHNMLTHDTVAFVESAVYKVEREVHRFLGLCRFSKAHDNTYVCRISPDHNILPLIADHFAARMQTERLVIYDEKRVKAVLCDMGQWIMINGTPLSDVVLSEEEYLFRKMWQKYFESISIKERTNKKLQRSFIPTRYWKNITELKDEGF